MVHLLHLVYPVEVDKLWAVTFEGEFSLDVLDFVFPEWIDWESVKISNEVIS